MADEPCVGPKIEPRRALAGTSSVAWGTQNETDLNHHWNDHPCAELCC
jgi:hypothetical protein